MIVFALVIVGVIYIAAQWYIARGLPDLWRLMSFLPIPVLGTIILGSYLFELKLPLGVAGTLFVGMPLGIVYLTALTAVHLGVQLARGERRNSGRGLHAPRQKRATHVP